MTRDPTVYPVADSGWGEGQEVPTIILRNGTVQFPQFADYVVVSALVAAGIISLMPNCSGISGYGQRFAGYSRRDIGLYDQPEVKAMTQHAVRNASSTPQGSFW
ncbi:hypothetical protein INS49_010542 [Diaporthe citri]|uniref:uncharacterized protein n=1 Tax=Diaporthe citri TaxID=83186 RepID=UPI001C825D88|nr:uncharacterized protein INS49_010542 [Diaporthe citri]KAG6362312.1 hypothetical protein INS49_010542 [Diaporthe citri]